MIFDITTSCYQVHLDTLAILCLRIENRDKYKRLAEEILYLDP